MGLAASQAQLLSITSRMADNELKAQLISNSKMRLAAESGQASEAYVRALNEAQMMFTNYGADGSQSYQKLSFNALTSYSSYNNQYGLANMAGQVLVSEKEAAYFRAAGGNLDAYLESHGLKYTTSYFDILSSKHTEGGSVVYMGYNDEGVISNNLSTKLTADDLEALWGKNGQNYNLLIEDPEFAMYRSLIEGLEAAQADYNRYNDQNYTSSGETILNYYQAAAGILDYFMPTQPSRSSIIEDHGPGFKEKTNNLASAQNAFDTAFANAADNASAKYYGSSEDDYENSYINKLLTAFEDNNAALLPAELQGTFASYITGATTDQWASIQAELKASLPATMTGVTPAYNKDTLLSALQTSVFNANAQGIGGRYTALDAISPFGAISAELEKDTPNLTSFGGYVDIYSKITELIEKPLSNAENKLYSLFLKEVTNDATVKAAAQALYGNDFVINDDGTITGTGGANAEVASFMNSLGLGDMIAIDDIEKLLDMRTSIGILGMTRENNAKFNQIYETAMLENVFNTYGDPQLAWIDVNTNENGEKKAQWYTNLFERMKSGYKVIEDGLASSTEWAKYALESGLVVMEQVDKDNRWIPFTYTNCADITEQTDSLAVTKAEAEYNRAMNKIEAKDKRYDRELKNIDTEHSSLNQEYDSVKAAIDKNIERSFKIYG